MTQTAESSLRFPAAEQIPAMTFDTAGGGTVSVGGPRDRWTLFIVYRGRHCPRCKTYLNRLQDMKAEWEAAGFDVVTVSADPREKADADLQE